MISQVIIIINSEKIILLTCGHVESTRIHQQFTVPLLSIDLSKLCEPNECHHHGSSSSWFIFKPDVITNAQPHLTPGSGEACQAAAWTQSIWLLEGDLSRNIWQQNIVNCLQSCLLAILTNIKEMNLSVSGHQFSLGTPDCRGVEVLSIRDLRNGAADQIDLRWQIIIPVTIENHICVTNFVLDGCLLQSLTTQAIRNWLCVLFEILGPIRRIETLWRKILL